MLCVVWFVFFGLLGICIGVLLVCGDVFVYVMNVLVLCLVLVVLNVFGLISIDSILLMIVFVFCSVLLYVVCLFISVLLKILYIVVSV